MMIKENDSVDKFAQKKTSGFGLNRVGWLNGFYTLFPLLPIV